MGATESPAASSPPRTVRAPAGNGALRRRLAAHRLELAAMALAGLLAVAWALWLPPVRDLAGQTFRVEQFGALGPDVWDNLWYGGHYTPGYSTLWPPLAWLLGIGLTGVLSAVVAAGCLAALLRERFGAAAAWPGALWLAAATATSLLTGRVVFALGTALGAAACLAAWRGRRAPTVLLGLAAGAASGVAAAFLVVAGAAAVLGGSRRFTGALLAIAPAAAVVALNLLFPESGDAAFDTGTLLQCAGGAVALLALAPPAVRTIRAGAAIYLAACIVLFLVPTALGGTMVRLGALVVGPLGLTLVLRARETGQGRPWLRARWAPLVLAPLGVLALVWQWNPVRADIHDAVAQPYAASTTAAFYAPLVREVRRRAGGPTRLEIAFTATHWEARWVAPHVAIARGWLRQLDRERNALFYEGRLTAARYAAWLRSRGVAWVAVADTPLDASALAEARIIRSRPPFLREVWRRGPWRLFNVTGSPGLVRGPGRIVRQDGDTLALAVRRPGRLLVRVRHTRYWAIRRGDACAAAAAGGWTEVRARGPGLVVLTAQVGSLSRLGGQPSC